MMEDFNSETDSDYTSYWRDWVSWLFLLVIASPIFRNNWDGYLGNGKMSWLEDIVLKVSDS